MRWLIVALLLLVYSPIHAQSHIIFKGSPVIKVSEGGSFHTFIAINGSGYVRIIKHDLKQAAALMSDTERDFDYVEHLVIGLRSVTYFGKWQ